MKFFLTFITIVTTIIFINFKCNTSMNNDFNQSKEITYISFKEGMDLLVKFNKKDTGPDYQLIKTNKSNIYELDSNLILVSPQYDLGMPIHERNIILFNNKNIFLEYSLKDVWDDKIYNEWEYFRDDFYERKHLNKEYFWESLNKKDNYFNTEDEFLNIESRQFTKFIKRRPENYIYLYLKFLESLNDTLKMEWGLEKCYSALNCFYVPVLYNKEKNIIINYHTISSLAHRLSNDWKIKKVIQDKLEKIQNSFIDLDWYNEIEPGVFKRDFSKIQQKVGSLSDFLGNE